MSRTKKVKKMEVVQEVKVEEKPPEIVWHTHAGLKYAVIKNGMCALELQPLPPTPKFQNDAVTPAAVAPPLTVNIGFHAVDDMKVV